MIHENFFNENSGTLKGLNCHEISFYFLMKPRGTQELHSDSYSYGAKEEMHWIPIKDSHMILLLPDSTSPIVFHFPSSSIKHAPYQVHSFELIPFRLILSFIKEYLSEEHCGIEHIITDERI